MNSFTDDANTAVHKFQSHLHIISWRLHVSAYAWSSSGRRLCVLHKGTQFFILFDNKLTTCLYIKQYFVYVNFFLSPFFFYQLTVIVEVVFYLIILRHTPQSVGLLWTRDRPVAETSTWQHKYSQEKKSMRPVGFEPTIPVTARPQTYTLGRAATVC
jgi:hypothetical protein